MSMKTDCCSIQCNCVWTNRVWKNTKDYQYEFCRGCNDIKSFHWKSFWKRLKNVFVNETINQ